MQNQPKTARIGPKQAAKMLGVSEGLLAVWRHRRVNLPFNKIGKTVRYDINDINHFLNNSRIGVTNV